MLPVLQFPKNNVKSITLIDIPNQKESITKENLKKKINSITEKIYLCNSIEESVRSINKYENNICLIVGSLYLVGMYLLDCLYNHGCSCKTS